MWGVLADAVVVLHLAFIAFAVAGAFLAWRWRWVLFLHVPALAWAAYVEITSSICPLTPLENYLRHLAGEAGYGVSFNQHYIVPVLYPAGLTPELQWMLAGALIGINAVAYGGLILKWRKARARSPGESHLRSRAR